MNYGAVLQAVALKRVLEQLFPNSQVEVVNHLMDPRDNHLLGKLTNPNTPWFQRWRNRRKYLRKFYAPDLFEARRAKTVRVIQGLLNPPPRIFKDPYELRELPEYDVVVVGSDQIWNPQLNQDFSVNQYLCSTFPAGQKRVSYAASFGLGELPEVLKKEYAAAISRFDGITVREESGAKICESLLGVRPPVVLDPTMLLNSGEWLSITGGVEAASEPYMAAYWVRSVAQADVDALGRYAREKGMPCRLMSAGQLPKLRIPENVHLSVDADPLDFVKTVAGAEGVITDSFHGLQFAVGFGKPVLALGELGNAKSNASRLTDFCRRYECGEACQELVRFREGEIFCGTERFDLRKLESDRERSLQTLKSIVGHCARSTHLYG